MLLAQQPLEVPEESTFAESRFQLDYLTEPNGLSDMLITWGQPNVLERAQATDKVRLSTAAGTPFVKGKALTLVITNTA